MCVPDLQGTQGTFTLFTTRRSAEGFKEGGTRVPLGGDGDLDGNEDRFETALQGPDNELVDGSPPLTLPLAIDLDRQNRAARLQVNGRTLELAVGELSDWIELSFRAAPGIKVRGICRMMVTEMDEHFSLYATPINIDPEKPAMPISHPSYYAVYLAKKLGKYATLGLAEDTWALNEGVIDDRTFLRLTYDIDREREKMFFAALDKLRRGAVVCVFDATDRIQHMFWRYLEPDHPAARNGAETPERDAIADLYVHNDALVGRIRERLGDGDVLMVLSDHGFASFRRGVNLNAWLYANGYLALKDGGDGSEEWLRDVDWSRTRAYALGLTGLFLNVKGREAKGIVKAGEEAEALKRELIGKLSGLFDEERQETAIQEAFDTHLSLLRALPEERAGRADRVQRRLPDLVGRCDRCGGGPHLHGQREALERRPRHRPPARAGCLLLRSFDRPRRSRSYRCRAERPLAFRHPAAGLHGRQGAVRGGFSGGGGPMRGRSSSEAGRSLWPWLQWAAPGESRPVGKRLVVLGFDGMDYAA